MLDFDNDDEDHIFPLTHNLGSSCVDPSNLVSYMSQDDSNIGMKNFKSRRHYNSNGVKSPTASFQHSASCPSGGLSKARLMWRMAARRVRSLGDPWADFKIEALPVETCIRHRLAFVFVILSSDLEQC